MIKKKIGVIGIDSGQIIICDPCYIDEHWSHEEFKDIRIYKNIDTGHFLQYGKDFPDYEAIIPKYNANMNQLIKTGKWEQMPNDPPENEFSYAGSCHHTLSRDRAGQIHYPIGHAGLAVAASTGYGDGLYDVVATYNLDMRIVKIEINFK